MNFSAFSTISLFSLLPINSSITVCRKAILHRSSQSQNFVAWDLVINKRTMQICLLGLTDIPMFSVTPEYTAKPFLRKNWA